MIANDWMQKKCFLQSWQIHFCKGGAGHCRAKLAGCLEETHTGEGEEKKQAWLECQLQYYHSHTQEEEEEESYSLAALYPPRIEEELEDKQLEEKSKVHFFCCKHPGRPVQCLPHADWHIKR